MFNGTNDATTTGSTLTNSLHATDGDGVTKYGSYILDIRNTNFTLSGTSYTVPSVGIYFCQNTYSSKHMYIKSLTYSYIETILNNTYLPKAAAVSNATGETPTSEEFNALLAALREAGYLDI